MFIFSGKTGIFTKLTPPLGSSGQPCGFESHYPYQFKKKAEKDGTPFQPAAVLFFVRNG